MRIELGCPGHFVLSDRCKWRRHTQVEHFRISTVGDYYYDDKRQTMGATGFFETGVFRLSKTQAIGNEGCGCREVLSWSEIAGQRYATAGEAQAGHERYVRRYEGAAAAEDETEEED